MTHDAMTEHYEEITVCGKPALFTSIRIKRDTIPGMMMNAVAFPARLHPLSWSTTWEPSSWLNRWNCRMMGGGILTKKLTGTMIHSTEQRKNRSLAQP